MGAEILVIFAFQIFFGYIYLQIGLIVTVFLAGLLPGALIVQHVKKLAKPVLIAGENFSDRPDDFIFHWYQPFSRAFNQYVISCIRLFRVSGLRRSVSCRPLSFGQRQTRGNPAVFRGSHGRGTGYAGYQRFPDPLCGHPVDHCRAGGYETDQSDGIGMDPMKPVSRRQFIHTGALALAASLLPGALAFSAADHASAKTPADISGSIFKHTAPDQPWKWSRPADFAVPYSDKTSDVRHLPPQLPAGQRRPWYLPVPGEH